MDGDKGACGDLNSHVRSPSSPSDSNDCNQISKDSEDEYGKMPSKGEGDFLENCEEETLDLGEDNQTSNSHDEEQDDQPKGDDDPSSKNSSRHSEYGDSGEYDMPRPLRRLTSNDEPKPNLIVNYLPQTLSDKDFFNLFVPYGMLESIKIMRDSQTGYSFGYGFVNYFDLNDAIEARNEMNGMQLGHKRIKVSFARPPSDDIKDTNLFVTGLSPEITETELEEMFSPFGVIVHLRVLRDRETKATRGVAFVRYETRSEACAAILELNGTSPPGSKDRIRVRLAQDHGKQKAAYLAGYQAALKFKGNGRGTSLPNVPFIHPADTFGVGRPRNMMTSRSRPSSATFGNQRMRAASSTSDQSLYWKGFIQGAREPRRSDSLNGRIVERRTMAGSSRSRY